MTKDDSNTGRKTRRTRRWLILGGIVALVAGAAAWGGVRLFTWRWTPRGSPASSAPKALKWEGGKSGQAKPTAKYEEEPGPQITFDGPGQVKPTAKYEEEPGPQITSDGSEQARPTVKYEEEPGPQITFDNLPEVPEKLLKPSPPIEDDTRRSRALKYRSMA